MGEEDPKRPQAPFRFLKQEEYEKLSLAERAKYLKDAVDALKSGKPVDVPSDRDRKD